MDCLRRYFLPVRFSSDSESTRLITFGSSGHAERD